MDVCVEMEQEGGEGMNQGGRVDSARKGQGQGPLAWAPKV